MTVSVVTWLWNDPLMEGGQRVTGYEQPQLRVDLQQLNASRRARRASARIAIAMQRASRVPIYSRQAAREFKAEHVVQLAKLFRKHLTIPHKFICVTDTPHDNTGDVTWIETPLAARKLGALRSPEGPRFPSCYRRLWSFSEEAKILGDRILVLDIDAVPVGNLNHLFAPKADFTGWRPYRDWGKKLRIGGGIYLMTTGSNTDVYTEFVSDPVGAIRSASVAGFRGSDQAWLSYKLAHRVPHYAKSDGIYSIRDFGHNGVPPKDAKLIQCNGPRHCKPWSTPIPWLRTAWAAV